MKNKNPKTIKGLLRLVYFNKEINEKYNIFGSRRMAYGKCKGCFGLCNFVGWKCVHCGWSPIKKLDSFELPLYTKREYAKHWQEYESKIGMPINLMFEDDNCQWEEIGILKSINRHHLVLRCKMEDVKVALADIMWCGEDTWEKFAKSPDKMGCFHCEKPQKFFDGRCLKCGKKAWSMSGDKDE